MASAIPAAATMRQALQRSPLQGPAPGATAPPARVALQGSQCAAEVALSRAGKPRRPLLVSAAQASTSAPGSVASYEISPSNGSAVGTGSDSYFQGNETVGSVMTSMVVVATPETMLGDILEHFAFYDGLPVVDDRSHHLVGMITNIDMYKKQRGKAANVANTFVKEVMTSPVVTVYPHTLVSYAAGLMLKYKVHRLPVVDRELRVVGIVTNQDLYQTLTASKGPAIESFRMVP